MTRPYTAAIRRGFMVALFLTLTIHAVGAWQLELGKDSKLWLEGDSTIHKYEAYAKVLDIDSDVTMFKTNAAPGSGTPVAADKAIGEITRLVLVIPIEDMKSPTTGLSGQMHKTLKYKEHPEIVFRMKTYSVTPPGEECDAYRIDAKGDLSLGGTSRPVELIMAATVVDERIKITGETDLLMSEFGIEPPTLMFGRIRTHDEIVIKWDLDLAVRPEERSETIKP